MTDFLRWAGIVVGSLVAVYAVLLILVILRVRSSVRKWWG